MFYIIGKSTIDGNGVNMESINEEDYNECVMGLSKILSSEGMFIISEDENLLYMKMGVK